MEVHNPMFEDKFNSLPRYFSTRIRDAYLILHSKENGARIVVYFPDKNKGYAKLIGPSELSQDKSLFRYFDNV